MTEKRVRVVLEAVGGAEAAEDAIRLQGAIAGIENTSDTAADGSERLRDELEQLQAQMGAVATAQTTAAQGGHQVAGAQQVAASQAIQLTQRLAAAAAAVQGLSSALGVQGDAAGLIGRFAQLGVMGAQVGASFGPGGAVVGAITGLATAVIPSLIEALLGVPEAQEDVEESTRAATAQIDDQTRAAREATTTLQQFLAAASTAGRRREVQGQEEVLRGLLERRDAALSRGTASDVLEAREIAAQIRTLSDDIELRLNELASEEQQVATARAAARGGGSGSREAERDAERAWQREITEIHAEFLGIELDRRAVEAERAELAERNAAKSIENARAEQQQRELQKRLEAERLEDAERTANREKQLAQQKIDLLEEEAEKREQGMQAFGDIAVGVSRSLVSAVAAITAGTKSADEAFKGMLASFLESIAEQALISAAREYAEAIASFARYDFGGGAGHVAAGVAFTAVAVATGAAAGALSAQPPQQQAARPDRAGGDSGGGGRLQIVNNWNAPAVTAGTDAELGRQFERYSDRAAQRFGRLAA